MAASPAYSPAMAQERVQDESARSDFIYRVNLGRADDVRIMIRQGSSPNQLNGEGVPVLCLAAARVDPEGPEVIHALLETGANLNGRDSKGQNALFYAAKSGNTGSIQYLLEAGIDMYAIDNNGDVARTAAHKNGQLDSIKAMDDFVLRSTAQITQQYVQQASDKSGIKKKPARRSQQDSGRTLSPAATATTALDAAEMPDIPISLPDAAAPAAGVAPAPAPAGDIAPPPPAPELAVPVLAGLPPQLPAATATATPTIVAPTPEELAAKKAAEEAEQARKDEEMKAVIYDMSFNICAFQYWFYCSTAKQSTDLDQEEMIIAIESSQTKAEKLQKQLGTEYKLPKAYIEGISSSAQSRIYRELNEMASNRDRHEKGVGKRDDMQKRCELIARQWGVKSPGNADEAINPKAAAAAGSKGGSKGGNNTGSSKSAPITVSTSSSASTASSSKGGNKSSKGGKSRQK